MLKKSFSILLCGLMLVQNITLPALAQEETMIEETSSATTLHIDLSHVLTYQSDSINIHLDGADLLKGATTILNSYPSYIQTSIRQWLIETQDSEKNITSGATISFHFTLPQGATFDEGHQIQEISTLNEFCQVIPLSTTSSQASFGLKIASNTTYGQLVDAIESSMIGEYILSIPVTSQKAISSEDILLQGEMDSLYHLSKLGDIVIPVSFSNEMSSTFEIEEMDTNPSNTSHTIARTVLIEPTLKINGEDSLTLLEGSTFSLTGTLDISALKQDLNAVWEDHSTKYSSTDFNEEDSTDNEQESPAKNHLEGETQNSSNLEFKNTLEAFQVNRISMHLETKLFLPSGIELPEKLLDHIIFNDKSLKNYFTLTVKSLENNELVLDFELDETKLDSPNLQGIFTMLDRLSDTLQIDISGFKATQANASPYTIRGTVNGKLEGTASWIEEKETEDSKITHQYTVAYDFKDKKVETSTLPSENAQTSVEVTVLNSIHATPPGNGDIIEDFSSLNLSAEDISVLQDKIEDLEKEINSTSHNPYGYTFKILEATPFPTDSSENPKIRLKLTVSLKPESTINLIFKNLKKKNEAAFLNYETSSTDSYEIRDYGEEVIIKGIQVQDVFGKDGRINSDRIKDILKDQYEVDALQFGSSQTQNSSFHITDLNQPITIEVTGSTPTPIYSGGGSKKTNKKPTEPQPTDPTDQPTSSTSKNKKVLYRLYNTVTGEHFFTANQEERDALLADEAWGDEGQGWKTPEFSNLPIYRLCNPNNGDHHYTADKNEYDVLQTHGWVGEGIAMYSAQAEDENIILLHRLYNPYAQGAGSHHYTVNEVERDELVKQGWNYEGTAWYGLTDSEEN